MQFARTFGYQVDVIEKRFFAKVSKTDGCWMWTGRRAGKSKAYGSMRVKPKGPWAMMAAHRVAYRLLIGEIPAGLTLDHKCGVTLCVNPDHLEAVSLAENTRRRHDVQRMVKACRKCSQPISANFTFCRGCWKSLDAQHRDAISAAFEPGVPIAKQTSPAYWAAIDAACA